MLSDPFRYTSKLSFQKLGKALWPEEFEELHATFIPPISTFTMFCVSYLAKTGSQSSEFDEAWALAIDSLRAQKVRARPSETGHLDAILDTIL